MLYIMCRICPRSFYSSVETSIYIFMNDGETDANIALKSVPFIHSSSLYLYIDLSSSSKEGRDYKERHDMIFCA
jgi:hypothetical protein